MNDYGPLRDLIDEFGNSVSCLSLIALQQSVFMLLYIYNIMEILYIIFDIVIFIIFLKKTEENNRIVIFSCALASVWSCLPIYVHNNPHTYMHTYAHTGTHIQTDRQADRQTDRQTDR